MLSRIFNGDTYVMLEKAIDASKLRAQVTAHNIANGDTPDFKRSYVEFEEYMLNALENESDFQMRETRRGHIQPDNDGISGVNAMVIQDRTSTLRMDGNNVDVEHEKTEQAKNQIHFNTLIEQMNSEFRRVRIAMGKG